MLRFVYVIIHTVLCVSCLPAMGEPLYQPTKKNSVALINLSVIALKLKHRSLWQNVCISSWDQLTYSKRSFEFIEHKMSAGDTSTITKARDLWEPYFKYENTCFWQPQSHLHLLYLRLKLVWKAIIFIKRLTKLN